MDQQDPEEKTVQRGQRVAQGSLEILDRSAPLVRRVNLEFLGYQATQEGKDQRDLRASKASLAPTERRALGVQEESQAHADREDQRGREEREGREDRRGKLDQKVTQETTARQDLLERGVCQGLRDQQVFQDQRALLDPQGKTDCLDILDREERLDSKARPALLALQVWLDLRDQQVRLVQWEIEVTRDPQAHPVSTVCLERQEKKELRVTRVLRAQRVRMALLGKEVSLEREAFQALWGLTV